MILGKIGQVTKLKKALIILAVSGLIFSMAGPAAADDGRLAVGAGFGLTTLNAGAPPWFTLGREFGLKIETGFKGKWRLEIGYNTYKVYDDISAGGEFSLSSDADNRTRAWRGYNFDAVIKRRWFPFSRKLGFCAGLGGGFANWRMADPASGLTLETSGERGETVKFSASEIFLTGLVGTEYRVHDRWKLGLDFHSNYMTGIGLEFDESVEKSLSDWNLRLDLSISYLFGADRSTDRWEDIESSRRVTVDEKRSEVVRPEPAAAVPVTMTVASIDTDSDGDGVPDSRDNCPRTPREAIGLIDIRGCPIDSDADGIPDFRDHCPANIRGALVNDNGCPRDSDGDGVPDGLDDCPGTDPGTRVDQFGCLDLSTLSRPIVLNVRYRGGSFEIDPFSQRTLDSLARILAQAPSVRIEINGYTDNIGPVDANKKLSQKRANRVRDYLVGRGLDSSRLISIGRGEINFIASNNSESGRRKNRRIELIFYK